MPREIERQYLLSDEGWRDEVHDATHIVQGYLSVEPDRTVRIRLRDCHARITVKGRSRGSGRPEYEYDIPREDAEQMLGLCLRPLIEKTRHLVAVAGRTWEIDEFEGANAGLILAEVELDDVDERPELPSWIGEDVTGDHRFYNANLVESPYRDWPTDPAPATGSGVDADGG